MFDFQFDWDDSICVGIEEIDSQHREFFRIGRDLEQMILTGCGAVSEQEILDKLCEVREYMTYHFYTEEKFLEEMKSEHLERHRAQHEEFKRIINAVDCEKLIKDPVKELKQIRNYLQEWFFTHILQEDKNCFR